MTLKQVARMSFFPSSVDGGLLVLRVPLSISLFLKHGLEKLTGYSEMVKTFPDPVGIGSHISLGIAAVSDGILPAFIVLGLATRWCSLIVAANLLVAFTLVHHLALFGPHNGEMAYIYFWAFLTLVFTGPGRFSVDARL